MNILLVNAEAIRTPLADGSVHCAAFSPPYFDLRRYAGKKQVRPWPEVEYAPMPGLPPLVVPAMRCALGNEKTPEAFIGHLVLCCQEVKRVLRDDGVAWCVIGDSYSGSWGNYAPGGIKGKQRPRSAKGRRWKRPAYEDTTWRPAASYMPQGNIIGIPARLMFALQADGWICRNEAVWHKVAPMPSSVFGTHWERHRIKVRDLDYKRGGSRKNTDRNDRGVACNLPYAEYRDCPGCPRCEAHGGYVLRRGSWRHTRAHETVLMLTKKMNYFADQEAVREPLSVDYGSTEEYVKRIGQKRYHEGNSDPGGGGFRGLGGFARTAARDGLPAGRNPRDVLSADGAEELWLAFLAWLETAGPGDCLTPRPESYGGDHYAVYPTSLISQLIKAGCPAQCCPICGAGWAPIVNQETHTTPASERHGRVGHNGQPPQQSGWFWTPPDSTVLGYLPTCDCRVSTDDVCAEYGITDPAFPEGVVPRPIPGTVFDPFVGSGSTLVEALRQGKRGIGADLSAEYLRCQARPRLELDAWDAWHRGRDGKAEAALEGLPLFGG